MNIPDKTHLEQQHRLTKLLQTGKWSCPDSVPALHHRESPFIQWMQQLLCVQKNGSGNQKGPSCTRNVKDTIMRLGAYLEKAQSSYLASSMKLDKPD